MSKPYDYKKLYQTRYKKLPGICFWISLIASCAVSILFGVLLMVNRHTAFGIGMLIGGIIVAIPIALLERFLISIIISQRVVITDTVLAMQDKTEAFDDEELPDL